MTTTIYSLGEVRAGGCDRAGVQPAAGRRRRAALRVRPIAEGAVAGAVGALATLAALAWAPMWLTGCVAFFTAPVLLATHLLSPHDAMLGSIALVGGSMLLFAVYAEAFVRARSEEAMMLRLIAIVLIHAACLFARIGLVIGDLSDRLVL